MKIAISCDHGAQASYRVMSTVCCIGEAAGTAAALAAKDGCGVREVDVKQLQSLLKEQKHLLLNLKNMKFHLQDIRVDFLY